MSKKGEVPYYQKEGVRSGTVNDNKIPRDTFLVRKFF